MSKHIERHHELVIVGSGPAGMSAALVAGRALLDTVVINAENPRNQVTKASHGFLTRDGAHPLELLEIAKQQLVKYDSISYLQGLVTDVEKIEKGFRVSVADEHSITTDKILFATGYKEDVTKNKLPGIEKVYGKSVHPCPFCDGWEHRGKKLALFDETKFGIGFAKLLVNWSNDLILFTNGQDSIVGDNKQLLKKGGVRVIETPITELISDDDGILQSVLLESGEKIAREAGFILDTYEEPATNLPDKLGVSKTVNDWGMEGFEVDEVGRTNVEGLYIVGDAKTGFSGIVSSVNDGAICVEMMAHNKMAAYWDALEKKE